MAQHAAFWNGFGPPERFAAKNAILDEWCAKVGRDPGVIERTVTVSDGDLNNLDNLDSFVEAGATHLIYGFGAPFAFAPVERLIAWRDARNAQ